MKKIILVVLCLMLIGVGAVSADTKTFSELSGVSGDEIVRINLRSGQSRWTVVCVESKEIIGEICGIFEKAEFIPIEETPGSARGGWLYEIEFKTDIPEDPVFTYTISAGSSSVDGVRYDADNEDEIKAVVKKYIENPFDYEGILVGSGTPAADWFEPSEWARAEVEQAESAGIIPEGFTNEYKESINREQFCELAYGVLNKKDVLTAVYGVKNFEDTNSAAVGALSSAGIVAGRSDTEFAPNDFITREEAAVILSKMADALKIDPSGAWGDNAFSDDSEISDWARVCVYDCFNLRIMLGTDMGFEPKGTYTVEQAIATVMRLYNAAPEEYSFADRLNMKMPEDENYMFSPYSVKLALAMAANGAEGETKQQILDAAGIDDIDGFNNDVKLRAEKYGQMEYNKIEAANSVWINKKLTSQNFSEGYKSLISEYYKGEAGTVSGMPEPINSWISEKTHGLINNAIDSADFTAALVNTLYFSGKWQNEFPESKTVKRVFTSRDGSRKEILFMNRFASGMDYAALGGVEAVKIPYEYDTVSTSMYIIKGGSDHINPQKFLEKAEFTPMAVTLSVPKFRIEYSKTMNGILKDAGIEKAFGVTAEFEPMFDTGTAFIDSVVHKTYINVDEKGTEAAAVTVAKAGGSAQVPEYEPVDFIADEPFTFVIMDDTHNEVLFAGEYAFA